MQPAPLMNLARGIRNLVGVVWIISHQQMVPQYLHNRFGCSTARTLRLTHVPGIVRTSAATAPGTTPTCAALCSDRFSNINIIPMAKNTAHTGGCFFAHIPQRFRCTSFAKPCLYSPPGAGGTTKWWGGLKKNEQSGKQKTTPAFRHPSTGGELAF